MKILHLAHVSDSSGFVFAVLRTTCVQPPRGNPEGQERPKAFSQGQSGKAKTSALSDAISVSRHFESTYGTLVAPMGLNLAVECHLCRHSCLKSPMGLQKPGT